MAQDIILDREKCIGCGLCEADFPSIFKIDHTDNQAYVLPGVDLNSKELARAAENCPVNAIEVKNGQKAV